MRLRSPPLAVDRWIHVVSSHMCTEVVPLSVSAGPLARGLIAQGHSEGGGRGGATANGAAGSVEPPYRVPTLIGTETREAEVR